MVPLNILSAFPLKFNFCSYMYYCRCESSVPEGQGELSSQDGHSTSSVVTVLPSNAAADKFKITVFTEVNPASDPHEGSANDEDDDGNDDDSGVQRFRAANREQNQQSTPTSVVERSEGRVAALHATLENDLNGYARDHHQHNNVKGGSNSNSSSSRSNKSSASSSSAASAAEAAGMLMGGLSTLSLFGSAASAAAPKEEPAVANPFLVRICA